MQQAKQGDTVRVHYTGRLTSGEMFDSSESTEGGRESKPLEFTIGSREVIPGFEEGVVGLSPGESRTVTIPVEQAYGPYNPDKVLQVPRDQVPDHIDLTLGNHLQISQEDGRSLNVFVAELTDTTVTLNANHPLAGRELVFDLKLVEIL